MHLLNPLVPALRMMSWQRSPLPLLSNTPARIHLHAHAEVCSTAGILDASAIRRTLACCKGFPLGSVRFVEWIRCCVVDILDHTSIWIDDTCRVKRKAGKVWVIGIITICYVDGTKSWVCGTIVANTLVPAALEQTEKEYVCQNFLLSGGIDVKAYDRSRPNMTYLE